MEDIKTYGWGLLFNLTQTPSANCPGSEPEACTGDDADDSAFEGYGEECGESEPEESDPVVEPMEERDQNAYHNMGHLFTMVFKNSPFLSMLGGCPS